MYIHNKYINIYIYYILYIYNLYIIYLYYIYIGSYQHSGMTCRGLQRVWLGVNVYREKIKNGMGMFGIKMNWIQVYTTGGKPECRGNSFWNWICLDWLGWQRTYTNKLNAFGAPLGHNTKKMWQSLMWVWCGMSYGKISKPSVCGAMRPAEGSMTHDKEWSPTPSDSVWDSNQNWS